jgi:hypothetical protein
MYVSVSFHFVIRAREDIEKDNFFRFLEEYWRYMQEKEKQEEMHKKNQAKFSDLTNSWKR